MMALTLMYWLDCSFCAIFTTGGGVTMFLNTTASSTKIQASLDLIESCVCCFTSLLLQLLASRPTATVRLGDEEWLDDRVNGRPEVWYSNQWGTVCGLDSHSWTWADGELLCQQYGLSGRIEHGTVGDYPNVNPGTGRVWLDYLTCSSFYDWISQCSHNGWGAAAACTHANDGAISCRSENNQ